MYSVNSHKIFTKALFLACVLAIGGCSSSDQTSPPAAEELFQQAMKHFEDEDYLDAYNAFRVLTLQYQGSTFADDAQFYMGESQFKRGEFILAAFEYETLIRTMSTSEFASRSQYQLAMCYYERSPEYFLDQEYTYKAIDAFQAFLEYHPGDPKAPEAEAKISELNAKLARKEFESGNIYMRMNYLRAATVSFDYVLEKYHDTPYAEPALLRKGESLFARKRYREARDIAERFLEKYPSSALRKTAETLLNDSAKALADETKSAEEKKSSNVQGSH